MPIINPDASLARPVSLRRSARATDLPRRWNGRGDRRLLCRSGRTRWPLPECCLACCVSGVMMHCEAESLDRGPVSPRQSVKRCCTATNFKRDKEVPVTESSSSRQGAETLSEGHTSTESRDQWYVTLLLHRCWLGVHDLTDDSTSSASILGHVGAGNA